MEDNHNNKRVSSKTFKIIAIALLIVLFIGSNALSLFLGNKMAFSGISLPGVGGSLAKDFQNINDIDKYKKLFAIRDELYKKYDGQIDDNKLLDGAIKGMTAALDDPYTVYMTKEEASDFMGKMQGNFSGVGIQLDIKDNNLVVVSPIEGSPAEKAGVVKGDIILKVDDKDVTAKEYDKAVAMIRGEKGTKVKLTLSREGKGTFDLTLTRDTISVKSVKGEIIENGIALVSISSFDEHTDKEFIDTLNSLKSKGMKGIILDLRGNPGGYLSTAVNVVSQFIDKSKVIVSTKDKYNNEEKSVSKGGNFINTPLVVLTDEGTASAAEIVSGALKDYKAATLVGTKTFGKGVVQSPIEMNDGTLLKVTISKWYTPNGNNIHKTGIMPDIQVEYPKELQTSPYNRSKDPQFEKALDVIREKLK
ncbi:S41 family peptidase [Clostridium sp. 'White wine YQ']|uniref:S41 family peptidase n=1 Tax=Clostridium sp. 'White wine YQ' TaxID=3027474 RepID=UPI0023673D96|nr:S41 family peptidase [Clostridium sp. 'White wine YQ']MDD7795654.1 S41 family peptidase [Clostridium sp. 'White wine YQ']